MAALAATPSLATVGLDTVLRGLADGVLIPYLGEGAAAGGVPATYAELLIELGRRVALPRHARASAWAAAQYIESRRHRHTLEGLLREIFAAAVTATPLQRALAAVAPPMIIDTWYDAGLRTALAGACGADWSEVQGVSRAGVGLNRWYRYYDSAGGEIDEAAASAAATLLYKPHGAIQPVANFLISDSDYVEVLTEIDIQTPIPAPVRERRRDRNLLFIGCRFDDQLLRSFARQLAKRSGGCPLLLRDAAEPSRNEARFFAELGVREVAATPAQLTQALI